MVGVGHKESRFLIVNLLWLVVAVLFFVGLCTDESRADHSANSSDAPSYQRINSYVELFRDPTAKIPFSEIAHQQFKPARQFLNFGYTDDVIWLKVSLDEKDFSQQSWLIQFGIPYLDQIDSYQWVAGELVHYHKGRGASLRTKPFPHRDSLIPVHFDEGRATIYLRIFSRDGTTINAALMTLKEFERRDQVLLFFLGGYVGIMLAMALYNFFIFLSLRDRRYGYYVFFTLAVLLNVAAYYELLHEYLFQGSDWLNLRLNLYTFFIAIAASIEFVRHFLRTQNKMPRLDRGLACFHLPNFAILAYATFSPHPTSLWLFSMLLPLLLVIAICGIRSVYLGSDALSRYFLIAFALFITGVGMFSIRRFGVLAPNPFVNYTFMAGSVLETMILSFALAHQINWLREQKQLAQDQLIRQIRENNFSLEQMKGKLEETVKIRTAKLLTSLHEKEMLLNEVHHRVKNNLAVIASLLGFQILREENDSPVCHALRAGQSRIQSMSLVHELLCSNDNLMGIDVRDYFQQLSHHLLTTFTGAEQQIEIDCQVDELVLPMDVLVPCGLIATELITNSLKHAFQDHSCGRVCISLKKKNEQVELMVSDDGCGFVEDYQENLGMRFVKMMTQQLNGSLDLCCQQGSCWKVSFSMQRS
ncbi:7TM diverse intracellular signaling domain-containing protein [Desulfuromonas acetoxidans]|uniref:7TM diverse intracellular signaling domain-containing protein n=1 Tax=Desulfuromonas acetoxidans TaxID=891 RepID=UPI00292EBEEC|nr:7TM diverse intracellular signaling domain-containing protein [Desulfuromonas acetoxidans]